METNQTAGIILAAGESLRLGRSKQLLNWFGKTFIQQTIDVAIEAKLNPIIVVTGANSEEIESNIEKKPIIIVRNKQWKSGQSSSIRAGIKILKKFSVTSFVILLCDQPQVQANLIDELIAAAKDDNDEIIATCVLGQICPPTLFKVKCAISFKALKGNQGGRVLMKKFNTKTIDWKDDRLILDCDTEEDYRRLVSSYSSKKCA